MRPEYCGYFLIPHWYIFWHEKRRCQVGHMMVVVRLLLMCCLAWKCEFNFKQHGDVMLCFVIWPCMYAILVKDVIRLQNCRANHSRTLVACLELHYSSSRLSLWHLFTFSGMLSFLSLYILWYFILVISLHSLVCYPCSVGCACHQSLCLYLRISLWCVIELPCYINSMAFFS